MTHFQHCCALVLLAVGCGESAANDLTTRQNQSLFLPATDLVTNGVPGLTNAGAGLMVSAVASNSSQGGRLSLITTQAWVRRFDGPTHSQDGAQQLVIDKQGRVTVVGSSFAFPEAWYDIIAVRYAGDGTPLWTNRYDSPAHADDFTHHVAVDDAGNAYVVGATYFNSHTQDIVTIKYSADGAALWTNRYNASGTNCHQTAGIAIDAFGNLVVAFETLYTNPVRASVFKYSPLGVPLWTNRYWPRTPGTDHLNAMTIDTEGNILVAGTDYATIKYSPAGVPLWTNSLPGHLFGVPSSIVVDRAGDVIVTGDTWTAGTGFRQYLTMKFSQDGAVLWSHAILPPQYQGGGMPRLLVDPTDHLIVLGGTAGASGNDVDFTLTKLHPDGTSLWTNRFFEANAQGIAVVNSAAVDAAGRIYFATSSTGAGGANVDFLTVRYGADGTLLSSNRFDGEGFVQDYAQTLGVDASGAVYVAGVTGGLSGGGDFATVKYADYVLYTPPTNFVGADTFTFTATDSSGQSATGVVNVAISAVLAFDTSSEGLRFTPDGFQPRVRGATGTSPVILHASTNLIDWQPVFTNPPVSGAVLFLDAGTTHPSRFYRASQAP